MKKQLAGLMVGLMTATAVCRAAGAPERSERAEKPASRSVDGVSRSEHPRQYEVLRRDARERTALKKLYKDGVLDKAQYENLVSELKSVAAEDLGDAKANGGYITKRQQADMNLLLTAVKTEAKNDAHHDALVQWLGAHPRQAEVLRRNWLEEDRVEKLYAERKIDAKQRDAILTSLHDVAVEDHADAAANGGAITAGEKAAMSGQEKRIDGRVSADVAVDHKDLVKFLADHPRQAAVLRSDWRDQERVEALFVEGKIDAKQRDSILAALKNASAEDRLDAKDGGGSITPAEEAALIGQERAIMTGALAKDKSADAEWAKNHPRQAQVLLRARRERDEIDALVLDGKISRAQADAVLAELKGVVQEDLADAAANGGGITLSQQAGMDRQETEVQATVKLDK